MWKPTRLHAQQTSLSTPEILICSALDVTEGVLHFLSCGTRCAALVCQPWTAVIVQNGWGRGRAGHSAATYNT